MRTGAQYLDSLRDGRHIIIDGQPVGDVTAHPAFAGICQTMAGLYDHIAANPREMTFASPRNDQPVSVSHMAPRSQEELHRRCIGLSRVAEHTFGLVGRGPEHVSSMLAGFASSPGIFAKKDARFGENVTRFQAKVRDEHLYVAYTIIQPQIDRTKTTHELAEKHLAAGVYEERDDGTVIRGAQMLGTAATIADWLLLTCIQPLKPGDEDYAISLVVPINAPGLRLYARRSYAAGQSSVFDYPLSTRYDESDSLVVFRDVFVPWEQVFVYRDVQLTRSQFFETPAHVLGNSQAQIRLACKTKFLLGLAARVAQATGVDKLPAVQWQLGELASLASIVEGMTLAAEAAPDISPQGVVHPSRRFTYGAMGLQAQLYPKMIHLLRELVGGGVFQVPSSLHEFKNPDTAIDIERYAQSAGLKALDRVKLFKLVWDLIGSEFAGRHQQYEMFYAGAPFVAKTYAYTNYDFTEADALVKRCLASYGPETAALGS